MRLFTRFLILSLLFFVEISQVMAAPRAKGPEKSSNENEINRAEIVEYRSKLEEVIAEKYRRRISTRIEDDAFNVGAQVIIELVKEEKKDVATKQQEESNIPSDITLGILENFTLPESPSAPSARPQLKIKKVEILVGLHPKLGQDYKAKFTTWLKSSIKAEFQNLGSAVITDLVEKPKVIEKKEPEAPRPLNWEEKFGYFQNLIGFIVLAFFLVIGMIIAKRMPSKDAQEQLSVALRIQEMKNSQLQLGNKPVGALGAPAEKSKNELQLSANLLFDNYRDHQKKVAFIALTSPEKMDQALDLWFEEGEEGRKKIASLVDSVLTQYGINQLNGEMNPAEMQWQMPEKIRNDKDLPAIFRAFATLSLVDKTVILEKTYWDLLSLKTLSDKLMRPRFSTISQLPAAKIQKLLSSQDVKVKSLTLLHLPLEKLNQVMNEMSFDEKKTAVIQAFSFTRVREKELELLDESLRFNVKKEDTAQEGTIEVQSLIPNMLMSLKPMEELNLLRDIVPKLPDHGEYLKQNYPSLAFVTEWPEDKIKLLVGNATTQEVLSLIHALPDLSTKVLASLPSRTKMIVQDEIGKKQIESVELNQHLEGMKYRLFKMVNDGQVSLLQIFKSSANASSGKAA